MEADLEQQRQGLTQQSGDSSVGDYDEGLRSTDGCSSGTGSSLEIVGCVNVDQADTFDEDRRQLCSSSLHEKYLSVDGGKGDIEKREEGVEANGQQVRASSLRKKVKHRHCKAAIMICVIWSITVVLISIALGMDWFNEGLYDSNHEHLCTLCGDSGLDFMLDKMSLWPTTQPSSSKEALSIGTIDPPPANLAEICSPSIHLHSGSQYNSLENCARACLPAACCLKNDERAQNGLLSMLGLEGTADAKASSFFSTLSDCNHGDDIAVCDAYGEWCASLYRLDYVLQESLPAHYFHTCYRKQQNARGGITASSRPYNSAEERACEDLCLPVTCCYHDPDISYSDAMRKRHRQHSYDYNIDIKLSVEHESARRHAEENECQNFSAQDPLNAQICEAYSPFCDRDDSTDAAIIFTSLPSGEPTQGQTWNPSLLVSMRPSPASSRSAGSKSRAPTTWPSKADNVESLYSLAPTDLATSGPMFQQTAPPLPSLRPTPHPTRSLLPSSSSSLPSNDVDSLFESGVPSSSDQTYLPSLLPSGPAISGAARYSNQTASALPSSQPPTSLPSNSLGPSQFPSTSAFPSSHSGAPT